MTTARTGSTPTPFGFVGQGQYQADADTGLMLVGHRYYDPSTGRFLSADPAQAGANWYDYCDNNPLDRADPQGLDPGTSFGNYNPGGTNGQTTTFQQVAEGTVFGKPTNNPTHKTPPGSIPYPVGSGTGTVGIGVSNSGQSTITGMGGGTFPVKVVYTPPIGLQPPGTPTNGNGHGGWGATFGVANGGIGVGGTFSSVNGSTMTGVVLSLGPPNGFGATATIGSSTNGAGKTTGVSSIGVIYKSGTYSGSATLTQTNGGLSGFQFMGTWYH